MFDFYVYIFNYVGVEVEILDKDITDGKFS